MSQVHEVYDDASRELCGITKKTYRGMLLKIILLFTGLTSQFIIILYINMLALTYDGKVVRHKHFKDSFGLNIVLILLFSRVMK